MAVGNCAADADCGSARSSASSSSAVPADASSSVPLSQCFNKDATVRNITVEYEQASASVSEKKKSLQAVRNDLSGLRAEKSELQARSEEAQRAADALHKLVNDLKSQLEGMKIEIDRLELMQNDEAPRMALREAEDEHAKQLLALANLGTRPERVPKPTPWMYFPWRGWAACPPRMPVIAEEAWAWSYASYDWVSLSAAMQEFNEAQLAQRLFDRAQARVDDASRILKNAQREVDTHVRKLQEAKSTQKYKQGRLVEFEPQAEQAEKEARVAREAQDDRLPALEKKLVQLNIKEKTMKGQLGVAEAVERSLQVHHDQGLEHGIEPDVYRLASLPPDFQRKKNFRFTDLTAVVQVGWCVGLGAEDEMDLHEFVESKLMSDLRWALADSPCPDEAKRCVLQVKSGDNTFFLLFCHEQSAKMERHLKKPPPPRPNAFDLLRASLGDPRFALWRLRPKRGQFHERALGFDRMVAIEVPASLADVLRPYQVKGFQWLVSLAKNGLGAVLADDMGLGKTLQAIALLIYLKEQGLLTNQHEQRRPALVVVPPGLVSNWEREFAKWASTSLVVHSYYGPKRHMPADHGAGVDVVVTSYHTLRSDVRKFVDVETIGWSCMLLDEAQQIKNPRAQLTRAVKEVGNLIGHTRIALSGTPIENKVDELHCIHEFANDGYLGTQEDFSKDFSRKIEQKKDAAMRKTALELLKRLINPFQLRRLKTDKAILPDLPDRIDYPCPVELTDTQRQLYSAIQDEFRTALDTSRERASNHNFERRGHIFAMLEKCRLICCHPAALSKEKYPAAASGMSISPNSASDSGKCTRLLELLDDIIANDQKAIVFVMRHRVLEQLSDMISARHKRSKVLKMSGRVPVAERQALEHAFQNEDDCHVMLLTVGVGGVGLNLTAASHVIHFDRCYNPAKEQQATDRAHRLGQKNSVCVHTLVTSGTFEERLDEIMKDKAALASMTVTAADDWIANYSDDQVRELFMLRTGDNQTKKRGRPPAPRRQNTAFAAAPADQDEDDMPLETFRASQSTPKKKAKTATGSKVTAPAGSQSSQCVAEEDECSICMDASTTHIFMPCGHKCVCGECAGKVAACPICREPIQQRLQVSASSQSSSGSGARPSSKWGTGIIQQRGQGSASCQPSSGSGA